MAHLHIPTDDEASSEQEVLFRYSTEMFGRVANAVRVASHTPKLAQSIFSFIVSSLRHEITENLAVRLKALVILKTSTLNDCAY